VTKIISLTFGNLVTPYVVRKHGLSLNKPVLEGSLLNKSSNFVAALVVSKFIFVLNMILVTHKARCKQEILVVSEESLLNKSLSLAVALGATKFIIV
jgi:hypothetical protein